MHQFDERHAYRDDEPVTEPTTASEENWIFNFIVLTPAGVPDDSLGQGGPSDTSFGGVVVNTQTLKPYLIVKTPGI